MADKPKYASIIDEFLDDRAPDYKDLGLKDAKDSGDSWLDRTHEYADKKFMDEIADGVSHHTNVPATSKGATLRNRLVEKENASPRLGSGRTADLRTATSHTDDYHSSIGDDESLMNEVTESLEAAAGTGKIEKKHRSDAEIQRYVKELLNQGVTPSKIASQLKKLAEIELFNHQLATRYLQDNAGLIGMAYMEPNTFMDKQNPNYERKMVAGFSNPFGTLDDNPESKFASSNDCVRQAKAWKAAGIKPRAKSVKQVAACEGCSFFKKNGSSKTCSLYGLPVVGNSKELSAVVNKLTAGVPAGSKKAALVQIANRSQEHVTPVKAASKEAPFVHQASFTKERPKGFIEVAHFGGSQVQRLHAAGHDLKKIAAYAEKKYGALETSKAIREFISSLRKDKGKIIMAKVDADYLKKVGIHNEAIVGAAKCASCKTHTAKEQHKAASTDMVTRAPETFVQSTPSRIRSGKKKKASSFDSAAVAEYHASGHSVDKIFKAASAKYGSVQASKAIREWAHNLKNTNTKIALSQIDCTVLNKMGVKLSSKNAIIGAEKCASCSFRNGMHCGLTGGTLLSFPGMNQVTSNKKVASGAPVDGRSILSEFDLISKTAQEDIDMTPPSRAEVHMSSKMSSGDIDE